MNRYEEARMIPINAQVLKLWIDRAPPPVLDDFTYLNLYKARATQCGDLHAMAEENCSQSIYAPGCFDPGE